MKTHVYRNQWTGAILRIQTVQANERFILGNIAALPSWVKV